MTGFRARRPHRCDGEHEEVFTATSRTEWLGDRRSAERCRVGRSTSQARHSRLAQLRLDGETVMRRLWRGGEIGVPEHRRQETYDVVEIGLIINAGDPGLIGGA